MKSIRWLPLVALLLPLHASSQTVLACPQLPASGELEWETSQGQDFLYCRAVHSDDGSQAFGVMLREEANFRARRGLRAEKAIIDGHEVQWYRGDVSLQPHAIVRETMIELDSGFTAHIMLRVDSEEQRAESQRLAEGLRFQHDGRLGSN